MNTILDIQNVTKSYLAQAGSIQALKGVSLQIIKGETLALLGVNGAGKTTLSSIIATLHPPTSGDIYFEGVSIYKRLMDYRMALGYCPQRPNLDPYLSVEQNLVFTGRYYVMPEQSISTRVNELLEQFELEKYRRHKVEVLSGGYKQRVLLARALMHYPKIVILDEPTVGLDPHIRRDLWQRIRDLKKSGVTVILTTHYLDEAEALSDRVCMLHAGSIRLIDTPEQLKSSYQMKSLEDVFLQLMREEPA